MELNIRKMMPEDAKQVQQIAKTSWNAAYQGIIPFEVQENFIKLAYNDEMIQKRLIQSLFFVSELDGEVVGFANFVPIEKGKAELAAIYLDPGYQGKGIGTKLLQEGIRNLVGVREVYVNVEKENQVGMGFYKAKGFEMMKEFEEDFDGHILKTVRMVLNL